MKKIFSILGEEVKRAMAIGLVVLVWMAVVACATIPGRPTKAIAEVCNYASLPGKEFAFREGDESLRRFGYQEWNKKPILYGEGRLDYISYVGKKGKIQEQKIEGNIGEFFVAILETCEKVYLRVSGPDLEKGHDIYYMDTLHRAESLIGKKIWTNLNGGQKREGLLTDDKNVTYPLTHLENLEVIGLDTKMLGHDECCSGPFYLVVKRSTGEKGYLAFNSSYFFYSNPLNPKWSKTVVNLIKQRKIKIGMSEAQVLLSWGQPDHKNKSVGSFGIHEQWVYDGSQYVYMKNGKVDSFQTSQ